MEGEDWGLSRRRNVVMPRLQGVTVAWRKDNREVAALVVLDVRCFCYVCVPLWPRRCRTADWLHTLLEMFRLARSEHEEGEPVYSHLKGRRKPLQTFSSTTGLGVQPVSTGFVRSGQEVESYNSSFKCTTPPNQWESSRLGSKCMLSASSTRCIGR